MLPMQLSYRKLLGERFASSESIPFPSLLLLSFKYNNVIHHFSRKSSEDQVQLIIISSITTMIVCLPHTLPGMGKKQKNRQDGDALSEWR